MHAYTWPSPLAVFTGSLLSSLCFFLDRLGQLLKRILSSLNVQNSRIIHVVSYNELL